MTSTRDTTAASDRRVRPGHPRSRLSAAGAVVLAVSAAVTACGGSDVTPGAVATPTATVATTDGQGTTPSPATSATVTSATATTPVTATSAASTPTTSTTATSGSSQAPPTASSGTSPSATRTASPSPSHTSVATETAAATAAPGAALPAGFTPVAFSATSAARWFLLGTSTRGSTRLLTTPDAGGSWQDVGLPDALRADIQGEDGPGVAFSDARHGLVTTNGGFWATADGGQTWRNGGPGNAEVVEVAAGPGVGYALLHTASGGWFLGRATAGGVDLAEALGADRLTDTVPHLATSGDTVVVVSGDRTLRSTDGGRTFTGHRGPCTATLGGTVSAAGSAVVAWCATGTMGQGFLSTDRGATFASTGAGGSNGTAVAPTGSASRFAYAGDTGLWVTDRTGTGTRARGGLGRVSWVGFSSPQRGFAIATDASDVTGTPGLWRSTDGGSSWSRVGRG